MLPSTYECSLIKDIIPNTLVPVDEIFSMINNETQWETMYQCGNPVPRLVHFQGNVSKECQPIYRKPFDVQPTLHAFSSTVNKIITYLRTYLNIDLNHAVLQLYRTPDDFIGDHSDKTLDMTLGVPFVNLSFYQYPEQPESFRTMQFKHKKKQYCKVNVVMPHNSAVVIGWNTNRSWTHGVQKGTKSKSGIIIKPNARLNIVLRSISTFLRFDGYIFGQGGKKYKTVEELENAKGKLNAEKKAHFKCKLTTMNFNLHEQAEIDALYFAFAIENRESEEEFDWQQTYGVGFNVIDKTTLSRAD